MPKVELTEIKKATHDVHTWRAFIDAYMQQCSPDDPPELSDLLVGFKRGGVNVLQELEALYNARQPNPFKWKIQVICDEWGNKPSPGDQVVMKKQRPLEYAPGKPVPATDLNIDRANGEYEKKWIEPRPYIVDEKGCITCEFEDAGHFLNTRGVHYATGHKLCKHIKPHSPEPVDCPNGGKLSVWYHQFKECPRHIYDKLPKLKKRVGPRRGIDDLDDIRAWDEKQKRLAEEQAATERKVVNA